MWILFLPLFRQAIHWISRTFITSCPIRNVNTRTGMCVLFSFQFQASNISVWFPVTPSVTSIIAWLHCTPLLESLQPLSSRYCKIRKLVSLRFCSFKTLLSDTLHDFFYVHVTMHHNKCLCNKNPTRCTSFLNLFWHETLHVSDSSSDHHPEFIHCTLSKGICHTGL